jgi:hypothetical protein
MISLSHVLHSLSLSLSSLTYASSPPSFLSLHLQPFSISPSLGVTLGFIPLAALRSLTVTASTLSKIHSLPSLITLYLSFSTKKTHLLNHTKVRSWIKFLISLYENFHGDPQISLPIKKTISVLILKKPKSITIFTQNRKSISTFVFPWQSWKQITQISPFIEVLHAATQGDFPLSPSHCDFVHFLIVFVVFMS